MTRKLILVFSFLMIFIMPICNAGFVPIFDGSANSFYLHYTGRLRSLPDTAMKPYISDFSLYKTTDDFSLYTGTVDYYHGVSVILQENNDKKLDAIIVSVYKDIVPKNNDEILNFQGTVINSLVLCGLHFMDASNFCHNIKFVNDRAVSFYRQSFYFTPDYPKNLGYSIMDDGLFFNVRLFAVDDESQGQ